MKLLLTICIITLLACKTNTKPADVTATQFPGTLNIPKDSLAFYFPANVFSDEPSTDSFVQNWYSSALYRLKEPVLSRNFIGHDIYRFLWLRSFHQPVVFTLNQSKGQVWLNTKMLDRQPSFYERRIGGFSKEQVTEYIEQGYFFDKSDSGLLVRIADRKANIIYRKNISLSFKEWDEFEQLLAKAQFWKLPSNIDHGGTDGAQWIIEAHIKNKYHFVNYHSPYDNAYQRAGLFLIQLSGLKVEVY